jgi:hypothetical protein
VFPLWLYPRESTDLLDTAPREKTANLAPEFVAALTQAVGATPSPEDALAYIYAILYAPSYRARYADFLKRDFPRVPLTTNRKLFDALVEIGRELIALHTMQTTLPRITGFPVPGSNEVVKVRFTVAPAKAGAQNEGIAGTNWIPACAGMTSKESTTPHRADPNPHPALRATFSRREKGAKAACGSTTRSISMACPKRCGTCTSAATAWPRSG